MRQRIDSVRLSPERRAFMLGYRRARARFHKELSSKVADLDADLALVIEETSADACADACSNEEEV